MNLRLALLSFFLGVLVAVDDIDWFNWSQFWSLQIHHEQIGVGLFLLGFFFLATPRERFTGRLLIELVIAVGIIVVSVIVIATVQT